MINVILATDLLTKIKIILLNKFIKNKKPYLPTHQIISLKMQLHCTTGFSFQSLINKLFIDANKDFQLISLITKSFFEEELHILQIREFFPRKHCKKLKNFIPWHPSLVDYLPAENITKDSKTNYLPALLLIEGLFFKHDLFMSCTQLYLFAPQFN